MSVNECQSDPLVRHYIQKSCGTGTGHHLYGRRVANYVDLASMGFQRGGTQSLQFQGQASAYSRPQKTSESRQRILCVGLTVRVDSGDLPVVGLAKLDPHREAKGIASLALAAAHLDP